LFLKSSNSPSKTDHQDAGFHMRTGYAHRSYCALRATLSSMVHNGLVNRNIGSGFWSGYAAAASDEVAERSHQNIIDPSHKIKRSLSAVSRKWAPQSKTRAGISGRKSVQCVLFIAKGRHRIDFRSPSRWKITRQQTHSRQYNRRYAERPRIIRLEAIKEVRD
jgi:hypothetical protein